MYSFLLGRTFCYICFLFFHMLNGKQCTGQKQENIAIDDGGAAEMLCDKRTAACAEDEEENHAVIMQAFIAQLLLAALHETKQ